MALPSYHISGSHLDVKGTGTITANDIRTKTQYTEIITCTVNEGITELGPESFRGCTKLTKILLPDSLEIINGVSFYGTNIKNITIPKGVNCIAMENTFFDIKFEEFFIDPENKYFEVYDQCLYTKNHSILVSVPNKKKSIKFLNGVEEIGLFCFWASEIPTIYVPDTVKKLNDKSFVGGGKLTKIIFGQNS